MDTGKWYLIIISHARKKCLRKVVEVYRKQKAGICVLSNEH